MEGIIIAAIGAVGGIIMEMVRRLGKKNDQVLDEVTTNGGSSLKDKVNEIGTAVDKLTKSVEELVESQDKLRETQDENTERLERNTTRLATLEKAAKRPGWFGW